MAIVFTIFLVSGLYSFNKKRQKWLAAQRSRITGVEQGKADLSDYDETFKYTL